MFLGIDLGTSEMQVLLLSSDGLIVGTACHPLDISRPRPRWSEQDPEDWWRATHTALSALREKYPDAYARIQTIGLSGQMHGAVLLDANDRPLRPAILWNDMRSINECDELTARAPKLHEIAGNCAMPGLAAPKLLWIARHEPEHFQKNGVRPAAERLLASALDRYKAHRPIRCIGNPLARRRAPRVV